MVTLYLTSFMTNHIDDDIINQGVLIYYNNRLIRRLESPKLGYTDYLAAFLRLGKEDFYEYTGYISLKKFFRPNVMMTVLTNHIKFSF